ncbi:MAG: hypothetical protein ACE5HW_05765 [Candidatus Methanofastidiosia archaeon]
MRKRVFGIILAFLGFSLVLLSQYSQTGVVESPSFSPLSKIEFKLTSTGDAIALYTFKNNKIHRFMVRNPPRMVVGKTSYEVRFYWGGEISKDKRFFTYTNEGDKFFQSYWFSGEKFSEEYLNTDSLFLLDFEMVKPSSLSQITSFGEGMDVFILFNFYEKRGEKWLKLRFKPSDVDNLPILEMQIQEKKPLVNTTKPFKFLFYPGIIGILFGVSLLALSFKSRPLLKKKVKKPKSEEEILNEKKRVKKELERLEENFKKKKLSHEDYQKLKKTLLEELADLEERLIELELEGCSDV